MGTRIRRANSVLVQSSSSYYMATKYSRLWDGDVMNANHACAVHRDIGYASVCQVCGIPVDAGYFDVAKIQDAPKTVGTEVELARSELHPPVLRHAAVCGICGREV